MSPDSLALMSMSLRPLWQVNLLYNSLCLCTHVCMFAFTWVTTHLLSSVTQQLHTPHPHSPGHTPSFACDFLSSITRVISLACLPFVPFACMMFHGKLHHILVADHICSRQQQLYRQRCHCLCDVTVVLRKCQCVCRCDNPGPTVGHQHSGRWWRVAPLLQGRHLPSRP